MLHRFRFPTLLALAAALIAVGILSSGGAVDAAGNGGQGSGEPTAFSMLGVANVGGETVIVDVVVAVQPGQNAAEVARAALAGLGARPFDSANLGSAGFTVTGLVWDNPSVVQNYNPGSPNTKPEPASLKGNGQTALTNTHTTWDGVTTSSFDIDFDEITDRCPSLVRECDGPQFFDGNNDVAWLRLGGSTLGVTWFSTSIDEADIALNTRFKWNDGCENVKRSFDAQTVFLHENGHTVGLGHSDDTGSVMQPRYHGADCDLGTDDNEGATYLYDKNIKGSVSGTVADDAGAAIEDATVMLEGTGLSATTAADGSYKISGVPDPVTYDVTASADGFESATIARLTVDGAIGGVNLALTATGGGGNGGGGGGGALSVTVITDKASYANRENVQITVTVIDGTNPVEGAAVHVEVTTANGKKLAGDGTTNNDGVAKFRYKVNSKRHGVGTYTVDAMASKDGFDSGSGSTTFEVTK